MEGHDYVTTRRGEGITKLKTTSDHANMVTLSSLMVEHATLKHNAMKLINIVWKMSVCVQCANISVQVTAWMSKCGHQRNQ